LQIIDARFISVDNGLFIDITGLSEVYPDTEPGIIMCKNDHKYRLRDMFPLRETQFEGVKAKVPYSYVPILIEEYTELALIRTEFQEYASSIFIDRDSLLTFGSHRWDPHARQWFKIPEQQTAIEDATKGQKEETSPGEEHKNT
jgi:hypothetical protein